MAQFKKGDLVYSLTWKDVVTVTAVTGWVKPGESGWTVSYLDSHGGRGDGDAEQFILVDDILKALGGDKELRLERLYRIVDDAMKGWAEANNIATMKHGVPEPKPYLATCLEDHEVDGPSIAEMPPTRMPRRNVKFRVPMAAINVRCTYDMPKKMVTKEARLIRTGDNPAEGCYAIFSIPPGTTDLRCTFKTEAPEVPPAGLRKIMD